MGKSTKVKIVEVTWLDPHSPDATQVFHIDELDKVHQPMRIKTIGKLLRNDPTGITLACEDCGNGEYRGLTFIIKSLVEEIKTVSQPRQRKEKANDNEEKQPTESES